MVHVIVKNWEHFNRSFKNWDTPYGVHVKSKDHYDRLMKEQGMVSIDKVKSSEGLKDYKLSAKAKGIIEACKASTDSKGKIKSLGDNTIKAMKEIGAIGKKEVPSYMQLPKHYENGSFSS